MTPPVEILVCTTCRGPDTASQPSEGPRAGQRLATALAHDLPKGVVVREVECLSNCSRGCTIVLRGPGRWSFVYANLCPIAGPEVIRQGATLYRDAPAGLVPWRQRPEHFRRNSIARIPPLEIPNA